MDFLQLADKIKKVNVNKAVKDAIAIRSNMDYVIKKIKDRLYNVGSDGNNNELSTNNATRGKSGNGYYSIYTILDKNQRGLKSSNVTLKDSGKFYKSFKTQLKKDYLEITAEFNKEGGNIFDNFNKSYPSQNDFEEAITKMNIQEFNIWIFEILLKEIQENIKRQITR